MQQSRTSQLNQAVGQSQAAPIVWVKPQPSMLDCPPGLQYFATLDKIVVQQEINLGNVIGYGGKNRYLIRNGAGEHVYIASENTGLVTGYDSSRGFVIDIFDSANNEIMRVIREDKCCVGCVWCIPCCKGCAHEIRIEAPVGQTIGYIRQGTNGCSSQLHLYDPQDNLLYDIKPPFAFNATGQVEFKITSPDHGAQVGSVYKVFSGYLQEFYTNADNYVAQFTTNVPVKAKACIVAATFLIDFMYFESRPQYRRRPY